MKIGDKILALCEFGQNRSRFLAGYLSEKGYDTDFAGVDGRFRSEVQSMIDAADVVVTVHPVVHSQLLEKYDVSEKEVIQLGVDDRPEALNPSGRPLGGMEWLRLQQESVREKLVRQIGRYLQ